MYLSPIHLIVLFSRTLSLLACPVIIAGSSAVLHSTASALNTTASAVHQMFNSSSDRSRARAADDASRPRTSGGPPPPDVDAPAPPPTAQQFAEIQERCLSLQRQMDALLSRQSTEQRARAIDDEIEQRRKDAYAAANILYTPRHATPAVSPTGSTLSLSPGPALWNTESAISPSAISDLPMLPVNLSRLSMARYTSGHSPG